MRTTTAVNKLPVPDTSSPDVREDAADTTRDVIPVETIEEAAENDQEEEEVRGRGQFRRGLDN